MDELQFRGIDTVTVKALPFGKGWQLCNENQNICTLTRKVVQWTIHWPHGGMQVCQNMALTIQLVETQLINN